jgi:hypothetical protein
MLTLQPQSFGTRSSASAATPVPRASLHALLLSLTLSISLFLLSAPARAELTVLVGEPFDTFGALLPVGHTTLYLDRVCADGPLKVRMCRPGEPPGVAISRYHNIGPYDWLATPIFEFLYATERPEEALSFATPEAVASLRARYRHAYLNELFPDSTEALDRNSEWWESAGMTYTRRLWGYQIATTRAQDERLVAALNAASNRHRYGAYHANCANFVADWVNFDFPGLVHRNRWADLGFLLPKQVARSVFLYGKMHPEAQLRIVEIPQVPGSIRRSHAVRGGAETFLTTKRYVFPLAILQPEIAASLFVLYLDHGGWKIARPPDLTGIQGFLPPAQVLSATR